jgi:nitroreductase
MKHTELVWPSIPTARVQGYADRAVSREDVLYLLQTARLAPSARNTQIWYFTVLTDRAAIQKAAEAVGQPRFAAAPVLIAAQGKPSFFRQFHNEQPFLMIDVPIAMTHLSLAAREKGLALEWVFTRDEANAISQLDLDQSLRLVALGFLGYSAESKELPEAVGCGAFRNEFFP